MQAQDDEVKNVTFYDKQGNIIGIDPKAIKKEEGYIWPNKGSKITDSNKHNVTVSFGPLGYDSKVITTFEYWTR